jgi:peptidoglycan/LPS O-acetylase OafA/YrhL
MSKAYVTPLGGIINGHPQVLLFFILSGFVLPLGFFINKRDSSIIGGTFRRYLRLMLPVFLTMLPIYLIARVDILPGRLKLYKTRDLHLFLYEMLVGIWFQGADMILMNNPTWTLGIEFACTFIIYIVAFTTRGYNPKKRFFLYALLMVPGLIVKYNLEI